MTFALLPEGNEMIRALEGVRIIAMTHNQAGPG